MRVKELAVGALLLASSAWARADMEGLNGPVVRSSESGGVYAKSVPAEGYTEGSGPKGKTSVFRVGKDADKLICEYEWYAKVMFIGGPGGATLVRVGPWQRGRGPQADHLALGFYRDGKTIREYSTLEMQKLGSGVSTSSSHYTVFTFSPRRGSSGLTDGGFFYEAEGVSGKVFSFNLETGAVTEKPPTDPATGKPNPAAGNT